MRSTQTAFSVPTRYIVFDLETTGFTPDRSEIIEIGAVRMEDGREVDGFHTYVKPICGIPLNITALTGIKPSDVADAPGFETALPRLLEYFGNSTLVAHNSAFDCRFVSAYSATLGLRFDNRVEDSLKLARRYIPSPSHKLEVLKDYFGLQLSSHNALDDCRAAAYVVEWCRHAHSESA